MLGFTISNLYRLVHSQRTNKININLVQTRMQDAYRLPRSKCLLCRSVLVGGGRGTYPGMGKVPTLDRGVPTLAWGVPILVSGVPTLAGEVPTLAGVPTLAVGGGSYKGRYPLSGLDLGRVGTPSQGKYLPSGQNSLTPSTSRYSPKLSPTNANSMAIFIVLYLQYESCRNQL